MNIAEDIRISLRSIFKRPVESILLVLGIALGIGATAAGLAMISHSKKTEQGLLSSPRYREIIVQVSENSDEMNVPAVPAADQENITLTWQDLVAKDEVPDVQYAYLEDDTQLRLINSNTASRIRGFSPPGDAEPVEAGLSGGAAPVEGAANDGAKVGDAPEKGVAGEGAADESVSSDGAAPAGAAGENVPGVVERGVPVFSITVPEGPEPVVDEIRGKMVSPDYFSAWNLSASAGSLFTEQEMESGAPVIVLGAEIAQNLFEDGESLGRELMILQTLYEIVGILEPTGTGVDEMGIIPAQIPDTESLAALARRFGGQETTLHFTVFESSRLDEAQAQLNEWFAQSYGVERVVVSIPREEVEAAGERTARLTMIILFLAISGLLIAAVNVSNILLGRAMRKRKNVGILKALGATVKNVFELFFLEALLIGIAGAAVGAGVSVLLSNLMFTALGGGVVLSFMLVVGIISAWAITISITVFPALQASRIPAVEALHYE